MTSPSRPDERKPETDVQTAPNPPDEMQKMPLSEIDDLKEPVRERMARFKDIDITP